MDLEMKEAFAFLVPVLEYLPMQASSRVVQRHLPYDTVAHTIRCVARQFRYMASVV